MVHTIQLLHEFVAMYGSRITSAVDNYERDGVRCALLATLHEPLKIVPDLELRSYTMEDITETRDTGRFGVQNALRQVHEYDPTRECVIGLSLPEGDLVSYVVTVGVRRA